MSCLSGSHHAAADFAGLREVTKICLSVGAADSPKKEAYLLLLRAGSTRLGVGPGPFFFRVELQILKALSGSVPP